MTLTHTIAASAQANGAPAPSFEVRWPILRRANGLARGAVPQEALALAIEPLGDDRAMVAAWIDSAGRKTVVLPRQTLAVQITNDGMFAHVDVFAPQAPSLAVTRLAALSVPLGDCAAATRLDESPGFYAVTRLLAECGIAAGAYDPPRLRAG